jgi:diguanylate cyclase (GGDEF)-like protein
MRATGTMRRILLAGVALLLGLSAGAMAATAPAVDDTAQLFARADSPIKMSHNDIFVTLIAQLESRAAKLSDADKWHLRYLEAWQTAYVGQNDKARSMLEAIATQAPDPNLREQARATLINIFGIAHRYEDAFSYLDQALDQLPHITNQSTRLHVLGEAAQLLIEAGQYDLAIGYADQMIATPSAGEYTCIAISIKLDAEFHKGQSIDTIPSQFQRGITECLQAGDMLAVETIRRDMATLDMQLGKIGDAIAILQNNYADVQKLQYEDLASEYNSMLAEAFWKSGDTSQAEKYAIATVDVASKSGFSEPLIKAYQLLYQIARDKGDLRGALAYHEKYTVADNERLDDTREKALAYQIVNQQVEAKKAELDKLNKQNQILQLQQALDRKAVETGRLYIILLLTVLASIAFWLYRLKRSQLRFMRMARRDGLTGIFNRQHFVEEAEQSLRYAAKSARCASLILIDLDHFKSINDTHGHIVGDQVLRRAVSVCRRYLHSCDVFGRLGGEEFGILLPECSAESAIERAEQLRIAIHTTPSDEAGHITISASLGIASTAHHGHELRRLLAAADEALYRAKRDGRNRVVINLSSQSTTGASAAKPSMRTTNNYTPGATDGESFNYVAEK